MGRIALSVAVLVTLPLAPAAHAAPDRTDRIPSAVAPEDFRSYYVNPTVNLPAELTSERWVAVAKRSLERYGGRYLGITTASPDNDTDGLSVIGFSTQLPPDTAGRNVKRKGGVAFGHSSDETCVPAPAGVTTQSVATTRTPVRLRLRADRLRGRRVRRRTVTVRRAVPVARVVSTPLDGRRCGRTTNMGETVPGTVEHESDVLMDATPQMPWHPGPELPPADRLDLETVLLHELGHSAGLGHQLPQCDPSTPMRPSTAAGEYWRGTDEVFIPGCSSYPVTPDAPHGAEGPFELGASLGGRAFHVNPAVPAGYDSDRFVALARSIVERWGGTYAGTTAIKPTGRDGLNVIGFDGIVQPEYEFTISIAHERLALPAYKTCSIVEGPVRRYGVRRVTKKVRVRIGGRQRTLNLRRDRVVRATVRGAATGRCVEHAAQSRPEPDRYEFDLAIAHEMSAYEMGPQHPVLGTRVDMATLLASTVGALANAPRGDRCGGQTPVTLALEPGDWWRSAGDVRRVRCAAGGRALRAAGRSGPVQYVLIQD